MSVSMTEKDCEIFKFRSQELKEIIDSFENSDYENAKNLIFLAINKFKQDDDPYYKGFFYSVLIRIFLSEGKSCEVIEYTNKILVFSGMVLYEYGGKYSPFEKAYLKKVLKCYDKLIKENYIPAFWGKARILHFMNEWKKAHELYERALKISPDDSMLLRMYGRLFEDECKYSAALDLFYKVKALGKDPQIDCFIANVYIKLGNFDCAIDILEEFLNKNPDNTVALFRIIDVYNSHGLMDKALAVREKLIQICPYNTKYILFTQITKATTVPREYLMLKEALNFGFDYSVVDKNIGDFFYNNKSYEEAIENYKNILNRNPFYTSAYKNLSLSLMNLTKDIQYRDEKIKEYEKMRLDLIKQVEDNVPYEIDLYYNCKYADKNLEKRISSFEKLKQEYPENINFYLILWDLYKESKDDSKLFSLSNEMMQKFAESYYSYIIGLDFLLENEKYKEASYCLEKVQNIININTKKKYNNTVVDSLKTELVFFQSPDDFYELEKTHNIDATIYKELIGHYFDLGYKDKKYIDIAFYCIDKAKIDNRDSENAEFLFIVSLIYAAKGMEVESQHIFDSIFKLQNKALSLLEMIKITEDILDIKYLLRLFVNCRFYKDDFYDQQKSNSKELNELYFYQQVLLFLIHIKYIKANPLTNKISHYTSIKTLSYLLDDKNTSPIRLFTLNSANDLKEGKTLFDYLSSNIHNTFKLDKINQKTTPKICAVQTSFTLLKDALTMFRLYGKNKNGIEENI